MYRKTGFFLLIFFNCSFIYSQNLDSLVQIIIDQTNLDSLSGYVEILSGAKDWELNETAITIKSRHVDHIGNNIAADYLKYKLESWDLEVYDSQYSATGRNIYVIQEGYLYPDQYYIICAHYDCIPSGPIAPGADDNASGVANVLEAARILKSYNPAYSIIYALWDEEEIGHYGSEYFAEHAYLSNMDILGVINVDMIGFDYTNDSVFEIHALNHRDLQLVDTAINFINNFSIELIPVLQYPGTTGSDHNSFYMYKYPTIMIIEEFNFWKGDFNWYWHSADDIIEFFNFQYFHKISRFTIGFLTYLAFNEIVSDVKSSNVISDFIIYQNFPNPFNPSTTIKYQIPELSFVNISVYDVLGNDIAILINKEEPAGIYEVNWDAYELPSGIYFYRIRAGSFVNTKKMILIH